VRVRCMAVHARRCVLLCVDGLPKVVSVWGPCVPCVVRVPQVVVHWSEYRCEVLFGETRVCTVQVYLAKQEQGCQGLYVVEFSREEMDIFAFKRMWEGIRERLSPIVSA
jgi:hypothetical protein